MQGLWWVRVGEQENNDTVRLWVKMLQDKGPISGCNTQGPSFRTECGATFDHCTVVRGLTSDLQTPTEKVQSFDVLDAINHLNVDNFSRFLRRI